jgi:hypothetical protein
MPAVAALIEEVCQMLTVELEVLELVHGYSFGALDNVRNGANAVICRWSEIGRLGR